MFRRILLVAALAAVARPAGADDALPPATVAAVKKASVYVRAEGHGWGATGSGFVVAGDARGLLIATNHHVAAPTPPAAARGGKPVALSVVFDSGTKAEREYPATVVGADEERDLAVLRVAGVKDPPRPVPVAGAAPPTETMPVYTFGFPLGDALALNKGFPTITVGKASVSSLRNDADGDLALIQIDGNLNPGNSGGAVVDPKGNLVGVAVATVRDTHGIGLIIPAGELGKMLRGRAGDVRVLPPKAAGGPPSARLEVDLIDPTGSVRAATARYLAVGPTEKRPPLDRFDTHPDVKTVKLRVEGGKAIADIPLPQADGEVLVRVSVESPGKTPLTTRPRAYPLAVSVAGPPRAGWKEYTPRDRSFTMWVPEKPASQEDLDRTTITRGQRLRVSGVVGVSADGLAYEGRTISLPPALMRAARKDLYDIFFSAMADELEGRVTATRAVTAGALVGVEATIDAGRVSSRMRIYLRGARVQIVQVLGTADRVKGPEAEILLSAYRLPEGGVVAPPPGFPGPPPVAPAPTVPRVVANLPGTNPAVVGGGGEFFKDAAPKGGLLVGVEVVTAEGGVKAVMPLFRVGKVDQFGTQFGTSAEPPVTVKARPGYAVGGMTAKARAACDGFSLTFMRVVDGRLDPSDAYESEWVGGNGDAPATRYLSDGVPVVGLVGRANAKDVTGVGLMFEGQETAAAVAAPPGKVAPPAVPTRPPARPTAALPVGKEPTILGGAFDPIFKEAAPAGGLLIGFEIGTAPAFGHIMTRSARPIYRTGGKETFGEQRGTQLRTVATLKAKAGYAVGAISVMHGLGFDGLSVTFMKVVGGKLDPADSYESAYVGSDQKKPLTKIGGDGTPVIGIVGKSNRADMTGMGLLFQGQEGYQPRR